MLYLETVTPHTFSILEKLLSLPELEHFALVGGTALSLLYGHRISDDLDLFSIDKFENEKINKALKQKFKKDYFIEDKPARFGIFCYINGVKVDLVRHPHHTIRPLNIVCLLYTSRCV